MSWVVAYEIIACRNIWVCILQSHGIRFMIIWTRCNSMKRSSHCTDIQTSVHILCFYWHPLHHPLLFGSLLFFLPYILFFNLFRHSEFSSFQLSIGNLFTNNPWFFIMFLCRAFTSVIIFQPCLVFSFWFFSPISLFFCEFFMILSVYYYFLLCCFNPAYFGHFDSFFLFFFSSLSSIFFIYNGQLSICYNSRMLYVVT